MKKIILLVLVLISSVSCTIEELINETKNINEQNQQTEQTTQLDGDVDPIKVKPPTGG
jgi:hypothetical protein